MTKDHILAEIRRTAAENDGVALGKKRFLNATGIAESDWLGRYWTRWSDALREAGVAGQAMNPRLPDDAILAAAATIVRRLGRFPTAAEIRLAGREDPSLPSHNTFRRFGGLRGLREALAEYVESHGYEDLMAVIGPPSVSPAVSAPADRTTLEEGFVYLLKSGHHYKIGKARSVEHRQRQLAIQLPERAEVIHRIRTDDPYGIEAYWHARFAEKRLNGEWFSLTPSDVKIFKRRRFM